MKKSRIDDDNYNNDNTREKTNNGIHEATTKKSTVVGLIMLV